MLKKVGLTLLELIVVLVILAALAGLAIPLVSQSLDDSKIKVSQGSLSAIRNATMSYWRDTKFEPNTATTANGALLQRFQMRWLFFNPFVENGENNTPSFDARSARGWNGPYIVEKTGRYKVDAVRNFTTAYGSGDGESPSSDPTILDGWQRPIVIQVVDTSVRVLDVRIVSAGPDGVIDTPADTASNLLTEAITKDDIYDAFTLR